MRKRKTRSSAAVSELAFDCGANFFLFYNKFKVKFLLNSLETYRK